MLDTVWQGVFIDTLYGWCAAPATPGSTCAAFPTCNFRSRRFLSRLAATTIRRIDAARLRSMSSATRQLRSHACPAPRTDPAAARTSLATWWGWETAEALLERTSTVLAPTLAECTDPYNDKPGPYFLRR
jgi:hypothetical protein